MKQLAKKMLKCWALLAEGDCVQSRGCGVKHSSVWLQRVAYEQVVEMRLQRKRQGLNLEGPVCSGRKLGLYPPVLGTSEGNWGVTYLGWPVYKGAEGR